MRRTDAFSYRCNARGRCCRGKRIQTSPFEIAALDRHLGVSTGEFIRRFSDEAIPVYLRWRDGNQCIFFDEARGCTVHPARPLVCRLYPPQRMTEADGSERFQAVTPHPQSQSVYGDDGTVADWLDSQGLAEYLDEVDRYSLLVRGLVRRLQGSEGRR